MKKCNFKRASITLCVILALSSLALTFAGCRGKSETTVSKLASPLPYSDRISDDYTADWYLESVEIMHENEPEEKKELIGDFTVLESMSFMGIRYINVKIYPDGKGKMTHKYFSHECLYKDRGVMLSESSVDLNAEQTEKITKLFNSNKFWSIPTEHPDERLGCDGSTTFIEGAYGDKYNFIHMWMPDEKYEISKITKGVYDYGHEWGINYEISEEKLKELDEKSGVQRIKDE